MGRRNPRRIATPQAAGTWELNDFSAGVNLVDSKWVFWEKNDIA